MTTMGDEINAIAEITITIRRFQEGNITRWEALSTIASILRKYKITEKQ